MRLNRVQPEGNNKNVFVFLRLPPLTAYDIVDVRHFSVPPKSQRYSNKLGFMSLASVKSARQGRVQDCSFGARMKKAPSPPAIGAGRVVFVGGSRGTVSAPSGVRADP